MACACKVSKQLDFIHKKYGNNIPKSKNTQISTMISNRMKEFGLLLLTIPFIPIFLVRVIFDGVRGNTIRIDKVFKLRANV